MQFRLEKAVLGLPNIAIVIVAIVGGVSWAFGHSDDLKEDAAEKRAPIIEDVKNLETRAAGLETKQAVTDQRLLTLEEAVRDFKKVQTESFREILDRLPKPE